jgi:hypothetical protein
MNVSNSSAGVGDAAAISSSASVPMSPTQKMTDLFDRIDPTGSGVISQSQFMQAFQTMSPPASFQAAGATQVWSQLDPNGTGSVTKQDFVSGMTAMMKQLRGHHHHHQSSAAGAQALSQNADALAGLGGDAAGSTAATSPGSGGVGSILDLLA